MLKLSTSARLLAILCYGLPFFHDNALGGLVKPTIIVMAKKSDGGIPPKRTVNTYRKDGNAPLSEYSPKKKSGSGNLIPAGKTHYGKVPLKGAPKKK